MAMNAELNTVAEAGDISKLYTLIQDDPHVLEKIDEIPFVNTPLHIAAAAGCVRFATEIIRLKPSFARKLNPQGLSPMHLALQNGKKSMALRFVSINKGLVRVKGRKGLTPLHYVTQTGDIDLLARFLIACPDSIEDLTVKGETALHIAVKKRQFEALQFLVGWPRGAGNFVDSYIERSILNLKNDSGDTVLHISARKNNSQAAKWLIDQKIKINAKNLAGLTALDMVESDQMQMDNADIKNILLNAGALRGSVVASTPSLAFGPMSMTDILVYLLGHRKGNITDETRNAMLVVAVLVATTTYQAALNPPGGVYQPDNKASPFRKFNFSFSVTDTAGMQGKSAMHPGDFLLFWFLNSVTLMASTWLIYFLVPSNIVGGDFLKGLPLHFAVCYLYAMIVITPTTNLSFCNFCLFVLVLGLLLWRLGLLSWRLGLYLWRFAPTYRTFVQIFTGKKEEIEFMSRGGDRW